MIRRIDWVQILLDLRTARISTVQVASLVSAGRTTVQSIMYGVEPKYSLGAAILELHQQHCQKKDDNNPASSVGKPEVE